MTQAMKSSPISVRRYCVPSRFISPFAQSAASLALSVERAMPSRPWNWSKRLVSAIIASHNTIHDQASPMLSTAPNTEQSKAAA
jgi:hypothetical protein